jgi:hypothetical protein
MTTSMAKVRKGGESGGGMVRANGKWRDGFSSDHQVSLCVEVLHQQHVHVTEESLQGTGLLVVHSAATASSWGDVGIHRESYFLPHDYLAHTFRLWQWASLTKVHPLYNIPKQGYYGIFFTCTYLICTRRPRGKHCFSRRLLKPTPSLRPGLALFNASTSRLGNPYHVIYSAFSHSTH